MQPFDGKSTSLLEPLSHEPHQVGASEECHDSARGQLGWRKHNAPDRIARRQQHTAKQQRTGHENAVVRTDAGADQMGNDQADESDGAGERDRAGSEDRSAPIPDDG